MKLSQTAQTEILCLSDPAKVSEKDFLALVKSVATANGWLVYHTHDSRRSDPGFPDLVLVCNGWLIFAELKTDKGKTNESQELWLTELGKTDAGVQVWRPRDWQYVRKLLQSTPKRKASES